MTEAYKQTRIRPEDVGKTTFSTIFGTFQSQVMQMEDCNVMEFGLNICIVNAVVDVDDDGGKNKH